MMPFVNKSHLRRFVSVPFLTAMMLMAIAGFGRAGDVTLAWDASPDENVDHYKEGRESTTFSIAS